MLTEELKNALQTTRLCKYLELSELEMLLNYSQSILFSTGEFILQQGKMSKGIYIIIKGEAAVVAKILGEGTIHLTTLGHGNFLGEISLFEKRPSATSVIASAAVECLYIANMYLEVLSVFFPEIKHKTTKAIAEQVCERLKMLHDKISQVILHSDMTKRSIFSEVVKSLTHPSQIDFKDAGIPAEKLKKSSLFESFTQDEFDTLFKYSVILKAAKQCVLIRENEKNSSCYIIFRGAVQSSIIQANKIAKLEVLGPMTIFAGICTVISTSNADINFTTCERAILLKITAENFARIQKDNINLWYKIFDLLCVSFVALERAADELDIRLNSESYNR